MLQEGYHKSFCELFALVQRQNQERDQAGPESALWNQVQLENEPEKLEKLKYFLTQAETSARLGKFLNPNIQTDTFKKQPVCMHHASNIFNLGFPDLLMLAKCS